MHRARAGAAPAVALSLQNLANEMLKQGPATSQSTPAFRLSLIKQNCIGEEKYSKGGRTCMAKVVVKKSPFLIQFGVEGASAELEDSLPDLHGFQFEARLVYEYDETKEVDFVKVAPMEFKAIISENGRQVNGEARVNVLTSQLEDMLFKIRIRAESKRSTNTPSMTLYSFPIKVVSKPDQVQKRRKKREEEAKRKAASAALASGLATPAAAGVAPTALFGHPLTDEMVRALQSVEKLQQAHQQQLNKVVELLAGRPPNIVLHPSELLALESSTAEPLELGDPQESWENSATDSDEEPSMEQIRKRLRGEPRRGSDDHAPPPQAAQPPPAAAARPPEKILDFDAAFALMMSSYDTMTPEQRKEKIRNVIRQQQISRDSVSEIHDLFWAEGLQRALGDDGGGDSIMMEPVGRNAPAASEACTCEDCPHKKELARIENFYREVFSLY